MSYRGRHRLVVRGRRRLRGAATIAAVTASALIAPLAVSGPVASRAAVPTTARDSLANHPEWLRSSSEPAAGALVADLARTFTERGIALDAAKIAVYRVPTVEGYTTYITATPQLMLVEANPGLIYHTPSGDTAIAPADVLARLVEPTAMPQTTVLPLSPTRLAETLYTSLLDRADNLANLGALVAVNDDRLRDYLHDAGPLVTTVDALIESWLAEALRIVGENVASTGPLVDQLGATVAAWRADAERIVDDAVQQVLSALDNLDPDRDSAEVFNVVPIAVGAVPVNSGVASVTTPLSQPVAQPIDPVVGQVPQVNTLYQGTRDEKAEWNQNNSNCFVVDNNAWFRRNCWYIDNQINDDSGDYTFWQFNLQAQSYPKQKRGMFRVWVEGRPRSGAAQQRFDRDPPEPKQELPVQSGCTEQIKGLSLYGGEPFQIGYHRDFTWTTCESYQPKGYPEEGHYATTWRYNSDRDPDGLGSNNSGTHQRTVAFNMSIKTKATDGGPVWDLLTGTEVNSQWP